jgi:four helix bundle protein
MGSMPFENLRVYQLAEKLADDVGGTVRAWDSFARDTVGKQLVRAADSVGANIAEGTGRRSFQDNRRFVRIARGSLYETKHWLRRAFRRKLLTPEQVATLKASLDNLAPSLNAYLNSIGRSESTDHGPGPEG